MENINNGFDGEISAILEDTFQAALLIGGSVYTPEQIKLMIAAVNIESLAHTLLVADSNEEVDLNLKQMALGLLGTSDWLKAGLDTFVDRVFE
jgi:hypothetical protein